MFYLKLFKTEEERQACTDTQEYVSYTVDSDKVSIHYEPFFCKLTLNNGEIVEIEGSGVLSSSKVYQYKSATVSAKIGDLCTAISENCFQMFTFQNVIISDNVKSINDGAFSYCYQLKNVTIGSGLQTIGNSSFNECTGLTSITLPDSITSIGSGAFKNCRSLISITIPQNVTTIANYLCQNCWSLTSITLPYSITSIGNDAFENCSGLTNVTIPYSVTNIGYSAFYGCASLSNITSLATTAPTIKNDVFKLVKTNGILYVPNGSSGYDTWMQNANYYLGLYGWTKVEQ